MLIEYQLDVIKLLETSDSQSEYLQVLAGDRQKTDFEPVWARRICRCIYCWTRRYLPYRPQYTALYIVFFVRFPSERRTRAERSCIAKSKLLPRGLASACLI